MDDGGGGGDSSFDVIVLGTALPNCILAAALSRASLRVLHLDANDYYGEHWATHDVRAATTTFMAGASSSFVTEAHVAAGQDALDECGGSDSRKFALDLCCCKPLFSNGPLVELLVRSGVGHYMEFKALQGALIKLEDGGPWTRVPASKADVFQSTTISLVEKRVLMKFLAVFQQPDAALLGGEWAARPFADFLRHHQVTGTLAALVWNAICGIVASDAVTTASAAAAVRLYLSSVGRFGKSPFLHPLYGCSEASQAFCRLAAVRGCVYMLRQPVQSFATDAGSGRHCVNGAFDADWVVASLDYAAALGRAHSAGAPVAHHAVCWVRSAHPPFGSADEPLVHLRWVQPDAIVHGVQLDSSMHVCPPGSYLLHMWCESRDALDAVLSSSSSSSSSDNASWTIRCSTRARQLDGPANHHNVLFTADPDVFENDYAAAVADAQRVFALIAPGKEFLPKPEADDAP